MTSARFDTSSICSARRRFGADDHAAGPRPLGQRAGRRVAIDEQLHARRMPRRRPDHAPDDARRRDHRHVGQHAVGAAAIDGHRAHIGVRIPADHLGRERRTASPATSGPSAPAASADRAASACSACSWTSRSATCAAQRLVLGPHAAQRHVVRPDAARAADQRRTPPRSTRENTSKVTSEQHPDAAPGLHLRRHQNDLRQHDDAEQHAGALADI